MTPAATGTWRKAGVMGLGVSGCAAAGFLARRGVEVVAVDARDRAALPDGVAAIERDGVTVRTGTAAQRDDAFHGCEAVIASPGVPPTAPPLSGAARAGIPVMAEVELASRFLRGVVIGITGSNGKSTVTSLTGHMLRRAGFAATVCGNIGTPLTEVAEKDLDLPEEAARTVHYVVELSSFQLEGCEALRPRVAVLLNLSPDHQDRYDRVEDYYAAKARLFRSQTTEDHAVVNADDDPAMRAAQQGAATIFPFSARRDLARGAVLKDGSVVLRRGAGDEVVMDAARVPMPGRHNLENVLAASSAAALCGAAPDAIADAVASFRPLPHRLEPVGEVDGATWVNDSKATNVGAAQRALEAFDRPVVLLLGGYDKGGDFAALRAPLAAPGRIRALVTFGKAGPALAALLDGAAPRTVRAGSLAEAVARAREAARPGDVVLLAPGCASFDAYRNFEERGEDFRRIVRGLASAPRGAA